jgi:hypothetical protein
VQALTNLNTQAKALATQNLTPAQLATQTTQLESQLTTIQKQQEATTQQKAIANMQAAIDKISIAVKEVNADTTLSTGLRDKYNALLKTATDALESLKNPPPVPASTAGSGPAGSPGPAAPAIPAIPVADDLLSELDVLDTARDVEENKEFNMKRFQNTIFKQGMMIGFYIFIAFGALLGGIIMSNAYAAESFWGIRLYYFVYGAAFFPLTLFYGAVNPPYWVSLIFPAAAAAPLVRAAPKQAGGGLTDILSSVKTAAGSAVSSTVAKAKTAAASAVSSTVAKAKTAVGLQPAAAPAAQAAQARPNPITQVALSAAPVAAATTGTSNIFTYTLVNTNAPTAADTSGRTTLRILSIVNIVCLAGFATYYGLVK